jgi:hypothetical protein
MSTPPTGIINLFLHPPIGTMTLELVPGEPFTGLVSVSRPRPGVGTDAFGIRYLITSIPAGYGITPGPGTNVVDRTVVAIAVIHRLLDGSLIESQGQSFRTTSGQLLFQESFPSQVTLEIAPGIQLRLWWLLVL